ncbi:translation initiation factor IF-2 [Parus major]|uniref:translation initiation factor IF-2 n=1 Tax=Parus major TaxID=9157 RepID=UPI0014441056|nr:translation initiation factor IF-2 [Parus major]
MAEAGAQSERAAPRAGTEEEKPPTGSQGPVTAGRGKPAGGPSLSFRFSFHFLFFSPPLPPLVPSFPPSSPARPVLPLPGAGGWRRPPRTASCRRPGSGAAPGAGRGGHEGGLRDGPERAPAMGERRRGESGEPGTGFPAESEELLERAVELLRSCCRDSGSQQGFRYSQAILVENELFRSELRAFARAKAAAGYSPEELRESFAFLLFEREDEVPE